MAVPNRIQVQDTDGIKVVRFLDHQLFDERTVRESEFLISHEHVSGEQWRRVGTYRAWQVSETQTLRTMEGRAAARPGDWVVEGHGGERWPVSNEQFRRTYRPARH